MTGQHLAIDLMRGSGKSIHVKRCSHNCCLQFSVLRCPKGN